MPVPPLVIGGLFVATYIAFRTGLGVHDLDRDAISALDELKEAVYAAIYALLAAAFLLRVRQHSRTSGPIAGSLSA